MLSSVRVRPGDTDDIISSCKVAVSFSQVVVDGVSCVKFMYSSRFWFTNCDKTERDHDPHSNGNVYCVSIC